MSPFKLTLTSIFAACMVIGIVIFATSRSSSQNQVAKLLVWGPISQEQFDKVYKASSVSGNKQIVVTYVQKKPENFDKDFIEALADAKGPDVVILREDELHKNRNKLFPVPYKNYSERTFKDIFVQEGELFLTPEGVTALPFMMDPLVMYWNRDLFTNNLIAQPPQYWEEVYPLVSKLTRRDNSATVTQSTVAFGEWRNISNAKEIISMLMLQAGTSISSRQSSGVYSTLIQDFGQPLVPAQAALNFYTQFSNPTSPNYSWNRSLPASQTYFLSGNLAMYFGFASELFSIQQKNSNLNFDVTYVPQIKGSQKKATFAHMYGLAIVKQSKQIAGGFTLINGLTEANALKTLEGFTNLPPVRRDMLAQRPTDAFRVVFYNSALISKAWIDPDKSASASVFRDMIEGITSGQNSVSEAVGEADNELNILFK